MVPEHSPEKVDFSNVPWPCTQEELERYARDDDETGCLELSEFIHELEDIAKGKENGA